MAPFCFCLLLSVIFSREIKTIQLTSLMIVLPLDSHYLSESTEAMHVNVCLSRTHNIDMSKKSTKIETEPID